MLTVRIEGNLSRAIKQLEQLSERRLANAVAVSLTRTAVATRAEIQRELPSVLDRPNTYTQRSLRFRKATGDTLEAAVYFPTEGTGRNLGPGKYLARQITGGARSATRFERALTGIGAMPEGQRAVPGPAATIDAYGGMDPRQMRQVLSALRAGPKPTTNAKRRRTAAGGATVFAVPRGNGGLRPGIYARQPGGRLSALMFFVASAKYAPRFRFADMARRHAVRIWPAEFRRAIAEAIARARR